MEEKTGFEQYTSEALETLSKQISAEIERRRKNRRNILISSACEALNTLHKEFPYVKFPIGTYCGYCECSDTVDLFEQFDRDIVFNDFDYM